MEKRRLDMNAKELKKLLSIGNGLNGNHPLPFLRTIVVSPETGTYWKTDLDNFLTIVDKSVHSGNSESTAGICVDFKELVGVFGSLDNDVILEITGNEDKLTVVDNETTVNLLRSMVMEKVPRKFSITNAVEIPIGKTDLLKAGNSCLHI